MLQLPVMVILLQTVSFRGQHLVDLVEKREIKCAPPSLGFSRQEYCSGSPCPPPGDLPDPGMEPRASRTAGGFLTERHLGSPIFPSGCEGKLGVALESLQGLRDLT